MNRRRPASLLAVVLAVATLLGAPVARPASAPTVRAGSEAGHQCAISGADHSLWCWGSNYNSELGTTGILRSLVPLKVTLPEPVRAYAAGNGFTCAALRSGAAKCWGRNGQGELGNNTIVGGATPVTASGLSGVSALVAGTSHACALLATGGVKCWGLNDHGQIGDGSNTERHVPTAVAGISTAVALSTTSNTVCAVLSSGSIKCWGQGTEGELGNGVFADSNTPQTVVGITAGKAVTGGAYFTCAIVATGFVQCWGTGNNSQLGDGRNATSAVPTTVAQISSAGSVGASGFAGCAALADGTVRCWGYNQSGDVGDGTKNPHPVPVAVPGLTSVRRMASAANSTQCAEMADASLKCWGSNIDGLVGANSTSVLILTPTAVLGLTTDVILPIVAIAGPPSLTNAATLAYTLAFSEWVSGLAASDLAITGTATGCTIGTPTTADHLNYSVSVTGCGAGTVTLTLKASSVQDTVFNNGPSGPKSATTVTVDRTAPTVNGPATALRPEASIAPGIPVAVTWTGSDASGILKYALDRSIDGGASWPAQGLSSATATSYAGFVPTSGTVAYRLRAWDKAGNLTTKTGPTLTPSLLQETSGTITYKGTWTSAPSSSYSGGTAKYASIAGASATISFTGRSIALVTTRAASRGSVKIYVDGSATATTVNLSAATTAYKLQVWAQTWATSGAHTVKVEVVGTAGHPRVDVDAFTLLK